MKSIPFDLSISTWRKVAFLSLFLILLVTQVATEEDEVDVEKVTVTVKVSQGILKGVMEKSRGPPTRKYFQFLGIPYGHVESRFSESVPAGNWEGARDAMEFAPQCFQRGMGEEQCLFLNVYTPSLPEDGGQKKLPVLVWIHGGAFVLGGGNLYGPDYWMDEDCIIVTFNYRLGVFGFLNLEVDEAPGNQGLKDQILALKWVKDNIHFFNGDADNVLIYGESAGAASISFLILSPLAKGLFHKAISQSGTALCAWALNPDVVSHSKILAHKLNCTGSNNELLNCMKKLDAMELLRHYPGNLIQKNLGEPRKEKLTGLSFIPGVESRPPSEIQKSTVYLPKTPEALLQDRNFNPVPYIVGINVAEGALFQKGIKLHHLDSVEKLKEEWMKIGPDALQFLHHPQKNEITEKIRKFYFDDRIDIRKNLTNLGTDRMFTSCTVDVADVHSEKAPTYLYSFDKAGGFSLMTFALGDSQKPVEPTHADEMSYQWKFNSPFLGGAADINLDADNENSHLYNYSREFIKMWVHFALHGKPMELWESKEINPKWEAIDPKSLDNAKWLHFKNDHVQYQEESEDMKKRIKFWKDLKL